jgi:hypothetical protein
MLLEVYFLLQSTNIVMLSALGVIISVILDID